MQQCRQQSGPPASAKDVKELLSLLGDLGHSDFRDKRGPMGLTQRQAAGKFTRYEAAALIERLHQAEADGNAPLAARPGAWPPSNKRCGGCQPSSSRPS